MAKRRGASGSGGNFQPGGGPPSQADLMRQIQKMQEDMESAQAELADENLEVSAGGGAIKVVINGHQKIQSIVIDPDMIDTDDEEWLTDLQDVLVAAMNQAIEQAKAHHDERMGGLTSGLQGMLPPGMGGLF